MISTDWAKRAADCEGLDSNTDSGAGPFEGCVGWLLAESIFFILTRLSQYVFAYILRGIGKLRIMLIRQEAECHGNTTKTRALATGRHGR